jgi:hypothetical protein
VRVWYSDRNFERRDRAIELANRLDKSPIHVALAYVLAQPFPSVPLIGPRTLDELDDSLKALNINLTPDDVAWLEGGERLRRGRRAELWAPDLPCCGLGCRDRFAGGPAFFFTRAGFANPPPRVATYGPRRGYRSCQRSGLRQRVLTVDIPPLRQMRMPGAPSSDTRTCLCNLVLPAGWSGPDMFPVLRQVIGYREPTRLGANKDMIGRADCRILDKRSHCDVNKVAIAHDRIEQRAAQLASRVVAVFVAEHHQIILALPDAQL